MYFLGHAGCVQVGGLRIAGASGIFKQSDFGKGISSDDTKLGFRVDLYQGSTRDFHMIKILCEVSTTFGNTTFADSPWCATSMAFCKYMLSLRVSI